MNTSPEHSDSPKISVIVPVYKVEKYLSECIESVLAQTFTDFELILVDDGSPDNSGKICDEYAKKDSRIRVFHKENGGVVSARMHGLSQSYGQYIIFLDGDDTWTRTALTGLWSCSNLGTIDFVRGGFFYEKENGDIRCVSVPKFLGMYFVDNLLKTPFNTLFDFTDMCVGGNIYKRNIALAAAQDIGEVKINYSEDGLFAVAAFLHSKSISFSKDPFYYYRQREGSALHVFNPKIVDAMNGFCGAMERILFDSGMISKERIVEIMREHYAYATIYCFLQSLKTPLISEFRNLRNSIRNSTFFVEIKQNKTQNIKRRILFIIINYYIFSMLLYFAKPFLYFVILIKRFIHGNGA